MKRREFITLLGGAATLPLAARAQQGSAMRRLGVLVHGTQSNAEWQHRIAAFQKGLEDLGWMEGRNIRVEWQFSEDDFDRLPHLAQALVASNPDVIFVNTTPATRALQQATRTIPIVFAQVSDPVGAGVVVSLARPGANITGFLYYEDSIAGKWLGMLKEIAPHLTRASLLGNPKGFPYGYFLRTASAIAPSLGIEIVPVPIASADDINRSLEFFARDANGGLLFPPDNTVDGHRDLVIALTKRYHLPAVYAFRSFVVAGGLMSYGVDDDTHFRQAASYVDRILRGAKPADLPVQTPIKYATVVNLKTAKAMGFDVPPTLLVRADEVIE
jgi:putative ABC transport system substrate-binding protein